MEATVISETVNVASRIEQLTKELGRSVLVSESTRGNLENTGTLEFLSRSEIRGTGERIGIYARATGSLKKAIRAA